MSLCSPHETRLIIFNRVPKCGSTSLEVILRRHAQERSGFAIVRSADFSNHSMNKRQQLALADDLVAKAIGRRTLYDRHMLYFHLTALPLRVKLSPPPVWINLVREPLRMQTSAFYFWRHCVCFSGSARSGGGRRSAAFCTVPGRMWPKRSTLCSAGYSMDRLYANLSSTPAPALGPLTRFFCGQSHTCRHADPQPAPAREEALRRAVHTLRSRYAWVGVLERFEDSLRLLVRILPQWFSGLAVERAAREHARPRIAAAAHMPARATYPRPTRETLRKLALENAADLTVYDHAVSLLDELSELSHLLCAPSPLQGV